MVALGAFLTTLFVARVRLLPTKELNELALAFGTAVLIWTLLATSDTRPSAPAIASAAYVKLAKTSARFAFTLYIVHFPLLAFLFALLAIDHRWEPDVAHIAYGFVIVAAVALLYAYPVSMLTEASHGRRPSLVRTTRAVSRPSSRSRVDPLARGPRARHWPRHRTEGQLHGRRGEPDRHV
jgi:peptidoglycan/LPS O-acetylase OafA/YrhL